MIHRVMVTSLYRGDSNTGINYYYTNQGERRMFCDAMLSAEASCKHVLANHNIDEIITFGTKSTHDEGDELIPIVLREGKTFYASDTSKLSTYSLLRYRLAEYIDEIEIERQDMRELLCEEEQEKVKAFLKSYFREKANPDGNHKFNRFFEMLSENDELWRDLSTCLEKEISNPEEIEKYKTWAKLYLYDEMRDSSKMEGLDSNDDVKIRFIPLDKEGGNLIVDALAKTSKMLGELSEEKPEVELYLAIQSDDASDNTVLMNFLEAVRSMPNSNIRIKQITTTTRRPFAVANRISDDTDKFGINELLAGTRSFLRYGKTDILLEYWTRQNIHNEFIEQMLYGMRNIDVGISLCDISDIERGINRLQNLFNEENNFEANSFVEKFFGFIIEGVKEDYGSLLQSGDNEFIDLVKWAYGKGFWQQTLTLIESRAPQDFIKRGIYYYCNSDEKKDEAIKKLGKIYFDLKPFEKFKMDDPSHYFIKYYGRYRVPSQKNNNAYQRDYMNTRIRDLDVDEREDNETIKAYTICPDRDALGELLFAYYHLGDVRNATNHAMNDNEGFASVMEDSDISERMSTIKQAIEYFIRSYDKVCKLIDDGGVENNVVEASTSEMLGYANVLRAEMRAAKYKKDKKWDNKEDDRTDEKEEREKPKESEDNKGETEEIITEDESK